MAQNLSDKVVAWVDADGGSRTGRQVLAPSLRSPLVVPHYTMEGVGPNIANEQHNYFLVKESCDGSLIWAKCQDVLHLPMRSEYENLDGSIKEGYSNPLLK